MRCLPFSEAVYRGLQEQGLDAGQLLNDPSTYQRKGSWYRSRFRLPPLGRQLLDDPPDLLHLPVSWTEALQHWLRRRMS